MNTAQDALYWREFAKALRAAKSRGVELDRHVLHAEALGADKSHKLFTNDDLTNVLKVFRAWSKPADLHGQRVLTDEAQARTVRVGKLERAIFPCLRMYVGDLESYVHQITRWWPRHGADVGPTIREMNPKQLTNLLRTLSARLNSKRNQAGDTIHEMCRKAGVECSFFLRNCQVCACVRGEIPGVIIAPTGVASAPVLDPANAPF